MQVLIVRCTHSRCSQNANTWNSIVINIFPLLLESEMTLLFSCPRWYGSSRCRSYDLNHHAHPTYVLIFMTYVYKVKDSPILHLRMFTTSVTIESVDPLEGRLNHNIHILQKRLDGGTGPHKKSILTMRNRIVSMYDCTMFKLFSHLLS